MEAHPKLHCLAWPMDHFFTFAPVCTVAVKDRIQTVIDRLGQTLVDLRIDCQYSGHGESLSDDSADPHADRGKCLPFEEGLGVAPLTCAGLTQARRRFITDFAARMHKLQSIKIEGGMPRDERRETLRALHRCPLQKVVLIGVSSPLGKVQNLG
jgi:hypothetical protein